MPKGRYRPFTQPTRDKVRRSRGPPLKVCSVGRLSSSFEADMLRRLKLFVVELREKRKEMPDPCAQWDPNGGDLGNGNWPAARINAADKQYTLEAVQAP